LVPISVEPSTVNATTTTTIVDATGSPMLTSFAIGATDHHDTAPGRVGDYHIQMKMAIANPVMVHVYMGVPLSSVRLLFAKYDMVCPAIISSCSLHVIVIVVID
jgi:hypothetical protein